MCSGGSSAVLPVAQNCDPRFEDCSTVTSFSCSPDHIEEEPFEKNIHHYLRDISLWVPFLDIAAGAWNYNEWNEVEVDEWSTAYTVELVSGVALLASMSAAWFADMMSLFAIYHKIHVLLEATMLYLVYAAEDTASADGQSTNFAYFVHSVSFVLELVTLPEISG